MPERPAQSAQTDSERTLDRGVEPSWFSTPREPARQRTEGDIDICPSCGSGLVIPVGWEVAGPSRWHVSLRCPECEWMGEGTYGQAVVDRFDEALDHGTEVMLADLKALARANLEEQMDRFVDALRADHILPEDF